MDFKFSLSLLHRSVECTLSCQVKDGFLTRAVFLPKLMLLCSDAKIFLRYINSVLFGLYSRKLRCYWIPKMYKKLHNQVWDEWMTNCSKVIIISWWFVLVTRFSVRCVIIFSIPVVCNSPFNLYLQKHFIHSRGCNDGYNKLGMYFITKINYIVILGVWGANPLCQNVWWNEESITLFSRCKRPGGC